MFHLTLNFHVIFHYPTWAASIFRGCVLLTFEGSSSCSPQMRPPFPTPDLRSRSSLFCTDHPIPRCIEWENFFIFCLLGGRSKSQYSLTIKICQFENEKFFQSSQSAQDLTSIDAASESGHHHILLKVQEVTFVSFLDGTCFSSHV